MGIQLESMTTPDASATARVWGGKGPPWRQQKYEGPPLGKVLHLYVDFFSPYGYLGSLSRRDRPSLRVQSIMAPNAAWQVLLWPHLSDEDACSAFNSYEGTLHDARYPTNGCTDASATRLRWANDTSNPYRPCILVRTQHDGSRSSCRTG